jgi:hypothetical protein
MSLRNLDIPKIKEDITTYVKERKVALEAEINQTREELRKEGFDFEDELASKTTKVSLWTQKVAIIIAMIRKKDSCI